MPPLISIVTPVLNAAPTLAETLESVVTQDCSYIEHLLLDAESTDGSLEIAARFPHLKICSEADSGIYDGMNKGVRMASGKWLLFLQADDWLPMGTLDAYRKAIEQNPDTEMICGGAEALKWMNDAWASIWKINDPMLKKLTLEPIVLGEPMINARLIRRDCFLRLGGFSLDYSLASDRDFLIRAALSTTRQVEIPELTYRYRWHSGSSTMTDGNRLTSRLSSENLAIARKHLARALGRERSILNRWHTQLTVKGAMNALETEGIKGLLIMVTLGCRTNPCWFFYFAVEILRSLPGFLVRGGKTRSQLHQ